MFESFEHTAYRLELRERYNSRLDELEVFVSEGQVDPATLQDWLDEYNNEAGEDIRYLARPDADALELPKFDYWMFDSRTVAKMHFDSRDTLLGFELVEDPAVVVDMNHARDAAWHHAVTRDDFAAKHFDQS